jgi:hypothetical protein
VSGVLVMERQKKSSIIVRRAAVYMLYRILLMEDVAVTLGGDCKEVKQILTIAIDMDPDEIVKGHARSCMSRFELDNRMMLAAM